MYEVMQPPLIAHVVYRFDVGGLENGIVNLINTMPDDCYRHAIISLTEAGEFKNRIRRNDVEFIDLQKKPGHDIGYHYRLWRMFRNLKPSIVHTRNIGPMEAVVTAFFAGVPVRVHSEHGWDMHDINGSNKKYQWFRRLLSPFVTRYISMSEDIKCYLVDRVGIDKSKVVKLYNGVDIDKFSPHNNRNISTVLPKNFSPENGFLVGTAGRMSVVKNPFYLMKVFADLVKGDAELASRLRLIMVGDGELYQQLVGFCNDAGITDKIWLPGRRNDIAQLMHEMDVFVLPSHNEGISNTILEAMASGLPVIATEVGGNSELVINDETGFLVESNNRKEMAVAIKKYACDKNLLAAHGHKGRLRVKNYFSLQRMVAQYQGIYDGLLA